jgi:hypothetical protein
MAVRFGPPLAQRLGDKQATHRVRPVEVAKLRCQAQAVSTLQRGRDQKECCERGPLPKAQSTYMPYMSASSQGPPSSIHGVGE